MNSQLIERYSGEVKAREEEVVEHQLAPVVRTYEELEAVVNGISGKTKVATSGFFNPIHKNHISNVISSKELDRGLLEKHNLPTDIHLTVVVNGDWSTKEKLGGSVFMTAETRADIVRSIKGVDLVFINDAKDTHQGELISKGYFNIFTKGGDRDFNSLPAEEKKALSNTGTLLVSNVGYKKFEGTAKEVSSSAIRNQIWNKD